MLSHSGAITLLQCLPGKLLRLVTGLERVEAVRHQSGNARGQGAAGAVVAVGQAFPGKGFKPPVPRVQGVDDVPGIFVGAGQQYVSGTLVEQCKGAGLQGIGLRRQGACLQAIGCQHAGPRQQQGVDCRWQVFCT